MKQLISAPAHSQRNCRKQKHPYVTGSIRAKAKFLPAPFQNGSAMGFCLAAEHWTEKVVN